MSTRKLRFVHVSRALGVLGTSLLALSGCGTEMDDGLRTTAGAGAPTAATTAGAQASGDRNATAGSGAGATAGVAPAAQRPEAGVGAAGASASSNAPGSAGQSVAGASAGRADLPGSAGMSSVAGAAAVAGRSAAGSGAAGMAAAGSVAAASGETGRMIGMTAAHNAVRARITNPAPNPPLPPLTWSTELAAIAQAYATKLAAGGDCLNLVHSEPPDPGADLGENLSGSTGSMSNPTEVVDGWAEEEKCYTFGIYKRTDKCDMNCTDQLHASGCGHYTQVVWRNTSQVGCGVATCGSGRNGGEVWVCNYKESGNYVGEKVY